MRTSDLQEAARLLREKHSFLIVGHVAPDGDCLGSMCAATLALTNAGKRAFAVCPDGVPDLYSFLPGSERVLPEPPPSQTFDVAISVDADRPDRLGSVAPLLDTAGNIVALDHHQCGEWSSGILLLDPARASTGEIVLDLLSEAQFPITSEIAECLLTAIITDTGSFRYSNTKADTLRTAADLVEAGASPERISQKVYETRSLSSMKLLGSALTTLTIDPDYRIAYACITLQHVDEAGASDSETEGVVSYVRSIRGADVGILFRETREGDTKVSLRSSNGRDISDVARVFGGGGHKAAAGCTVDLPISEAVDAVLDAVRKWMDS